MHYRRICSGHAQSGGKDAQSATDESFGHPCRRRRRSNRRIAAGDCCVRQCHPRQGGSGAQWRSALASCSRISRCSILGSCSKVAHSSGVGMSGQPGHSVGLLAAAWRRSDAIGADCCHSVRCAACYKGVLTPASQWRRTWPLTNHSSRRSFATWLNSSVRPSDDQPWTPQRTRRRGRDCSACANVRFLLEVTISQLFDSSEASAARRTTASINSYGSRRLRHAFGQVRIHVLHGHRRHGL